MAAGTQPAAIFLFAKLARISLAAVPHLTSRFSKSL